MNRLQTKMTEEQDETIDHMFITPKSGACGELPATALFLILVARLLTQRK